MKLSPETLRQTSGMDRLQIIRHLQSEIERMRAWRRRWMERRAYAEQTGKQKMWALGMADAFTEEMLLQAELDGF